MISLTVIRLILTFFFPSGILIRLEPNKDASLARLTIRSTNDVVSAEILELVAKPLNKDTMAPAA